MKIKEVEDWLTVESEEKLTAETTKEDHEHLFTGNLFSMVYCLNNFNPTTDTTEIKTDLKSKHDEESDSWMFKQVEDKESLDPFKNSNSNFEIFEQIECKES